MIPDPPPPSFSLVGGPLHAFGRKLRLVGASGDAVPLGLVLGIGPWLVLIAIAAIEGVLPAILSLGLVAGHVRMLVAVPMFFAAERWLDPRFRVFVHSVVASGVIADDERADFDAAVARIRGWADSWVPDALCLALAAASPILVPLLGLPGVTSSSSHGALTGTWTEVWFTFVCMSIFRFLVFRWMLRLLLWFAFLFRLGRLRLRLVPTHPDGAGGIGYLEVVHLHLAPLVLAVSAVECASFAEELVAGQMTFNAVYPALGLLVLVEAVVFLGPLFLVTPRLWQCRTRGLAEYMDFATDYVGRFERKWLGPGEPGEPLLGSADLQSLADLGNGTDRVRAMRWVPLSVELVRDLAIVALVPALPLFLLEYPIAELVQRLFSRFSGL